MTRWLTQLIMVPAIILVPENFRSAGSEISRVQKNYQVRIAQESYLVINGLTNLNEFACNYLGDFYQDTLTIDAVPDGNQLQLNNAVLKLRTTRFDCKNYQMNLDFKDLLQADQYPYIIIRVLNINNSSQEIKGTLAQNPRPNAMFLSVNIEIAGQVKDYTLPVDVRVMGDDRYYLGNLSLDIQDFGIEPPKKLFGLVRVSEKISIDFMVRIILVA
ncbi:MAG TPA: YceI family protein [Cyclobacteriaceae bacterium]|nr:YceI family protein [Cyclobacteriaceae bacterium]